MSVAENDDHQESEDEDEMELEEEWTMPLEEGELENRDRFRLSQVAY